MFKCGDFVMDISTGRAAQVKNVALSPTILIKYTDGEKEKAKVSESDLIKVEGETVLLTPAAYDQAVKEIMYEAAADYEGKSQEELDGMLRVIGEVCVTLKQRVFSGND